MIIGILALQGDFHLHAKLLTDYNIMPIDYHMFSLAIS